MRSARLATNLLQFASRWGRVDVMTSPKVPNPSDILAAAQAAVEAAQAVAASAFDTAIRTPQASVHLAAQMPDLIDNLANAVERLNRTLDRLDRTLALADPLFATLDQIMPRLEQLAGVAEDVRKLVARLPGVDTLGRITGVHFDEEPPAPTPKPRRR